MSMVLKSGLPYYFLRLSVEEAGAARMHYGDSVCSKYAEKCILRASVLYALVSYDGVMGDRLGTLVKIRNRDVYLWEKGRIYTYKSKILQLTMGLL